MGKWPGRGAIAAEPMAQIKEFRRHGILYIGQQMFKIVSATQVLSSGVFPLQSPSQGRPGNGHCPPATALLQLDGENCWTHSRYPKGHFFSSGGALSR